LTKACTALKLKIQRRYIGSRIPTKMQPWS